MALYKTTDGPNWENNTNWLSDRPIGTWHGVKIDSKGRVTGLYLHRNQLRGKIPPELGSLANLTELWLGGNELSGGIPSELGSLANLIGLWLDNNELSGGIPSELGSLANLTGLNLDGNELSGGIPPELGSLANLTKLWLGSNELSGGIPPELGSLANLTELWLGGNELSGGIPPELGSLAKLTRLQLGGNQHLTACIPEALRGLRATLPHDASSLNGMADCTGMEIVHTASEDPSIYNENVFVLPVTEDITAATLHDGLPLRDYAARFYERFHDDFDFLIFVSNLSRFNDTPAWKIGYGGIHTGVSNNVRGIGKSLFSDSRAWGSEGALRGAIHISYADGLFPFGVHEIMHQWGNTIVPTVHSGHWGFSSANGEIGGFDIAGLVDHGDGRYSAGEFGTGGRDSPDKLYSSIELYIAGLIPPDEVPDLWVAEDGEWLDERTDDGERLFAASKVRTYTIEDIIAEHGERIPNHTASQKEFRAAVVLLIDENHPLHKWQLDRLSGAIDSFSHPGASAFYAYSFDTYNFWEATGGRATMIMDGLPQSLK